ncbi:MAG: alpha/beta fold hydrolase [Myxococcota bacterium]
MQRLQRFLGFLLSCTGLALGCAHAPGAAFDPVSMDPPETDADHPAALVELAIDSHGAPMNAIVYQAPGAGPHPTVVLLHGFPGNERNLDLAHAMRRSGWNVVFFHYRGAWGSPGDFSFGHVLEDVASVVDWTLGAEAGALRIDPETIALVGHSMGGFAALRAGADHERVDCIVSLAGANFAGRGRAANADPKAAAAIAAALDQWRAPLAGTSGQALVAEIAGDVDHFDLVRQAPALAGKRLLLVAGTRDQTTPPAEHHDPLVASLEAVGATQLATRVFDADHAFSGRRVALAHLVTDWLGNRCP